jgi:pentatricopeptide repeat protein
MEAKHGDVDHARTVFDRIVRRNLTPGKWIQFDLKSRDDQ